MISGSGSLTQAGPGILTLPGSNTYTGGTTISAGTLQVGNGSSGASIGSTEQRARQRQPRLQPRRQRDVSQIISGSGSLTQMGTGILSLTGNNTYSGGTTISAGTLQVGNGGTTGGIVGNVTNNAALVFNRSNNYTSGCSIGGTGNLIQAGPATLTLTAAVSNAVFANAGRIVVGPTGMLNGDLTIAAGARVENDATALQIGNFTNAGTFLGSADPSGNFVNQSSGDVRISGGQRVYIQGTATQTNSGLVEVLGSQAAQAQFESAGPLLNVASGQSLITAQNANLYFDGGMTNQGSVAFSYGISNVFGKVTNSPGGTIVITGGAGVTFYNDVVQNGTLNVGAVAGTRSSVVFFGASAAPAESPAAATCFSWAIFVRATARAQATSTSRKRVHGPVHQFGHGVDRHGGGQPVQPGERDRHGCTGRRVEHHASHRVSADPGQPVPSYDLRFVLGRFYLDQRAEPGKPSRVGAVVHEQRPDFDRGPGWFRRMENDTNGDISATGNWAIGVPCEAGDTANFGPVISAPRTVTLDCRRRWAR